MGKQIKQTAFIYLPPHDDRIGYTIEDGVISQTSFAYAYSKDNAVNAAEILLKSGEKSRFPAADLIFYQKTNPGGTAGQFKPATRGFYDVALHEGVIFNQSF